MLALRFWLKYPAAENNLSQAVEVQGTASKSIATWHKSVLYSFVAFLK